MPEQDFYSFNEALEQLRLKEEELKRLVSEGEIRAFREGETMRLRKQDVENLRSELMGGEIVDLGEAGEELVFEDDADFAEAGMATEEISDMDTLLEEDIEDVGEIEIELEEEVLEPERVTAAPVRRTSAIGAASQTGAEETESMGIRVGLIAVSAMLLIGALPIAISISTGNASDIAKTVAGVFGQKFAEK